MLSCATLTAQHFEAGRHRQLPDGFTAEHAVTADFDLDGDLDLAALKNGCDIAWNDGEGRFVRTHPPILIGSSAQVATRLAAGDIDGDGDPDLVVAGENNMGWVSPSMVLRNDAGTLVAAPTQWTTSSWITVGIVLFDYDGDGDLDIVTSHRALAGNCSNGTWVAGSQPNRLYLNSGLGFFTEAPTRLPNGFAENSGVAFGDMDGDGDQDLVFATQSSCYWAPPGDVRLFVQNAQGVAVESPNGIPASPRSYFGVVVFDSDNDGDRDVLAWSDLGVHVFVNNGVGVFSAGPILPIAKVSDIAVLDLEGDGRRDLLVTRGRVTIDYRAGSMAYWRNLPAGFVDATTTSLQEAGIAASNALAFDADGDGDLDLCGAARPQGYVWWNDGAGLLRQPATAQLVADNWRSRREGKVQLADFDGDGDLDAALSRQIDLGVYESVVVENRGESPGFARHVLPAPSSLLMAPIDFDNDGDLDVLIGGRMLRNDGWIFVDVTATAFPGPPAGEVATVGDLDGDQLDDLVTADVYGLHLYRSTGSGTFTNQSFLLPALVFGGAEPGVGLLDFDHDGDLDIAETGLGGVRILRNNWPAPFVNTAAIPPTVAQGLALIDVDRDGWTDVLASSVGVRLFRNLGGTFVDETATRLPASLGFFTYLLSPGDLDGDGWMDLVGSNSVDDMDWKTLRNNQGVFVASTNATLPANGNWTVLPAFGDVDRDGDTDVLAGEGLTRNRTRHLVNAVPPRLGKHGELTLAGFDDSQSNGVLAALFVSPQRLQPAVEVSGIGVLFVDPSQATLHSMHALPGTGGEATVRYLLPSTPGLIGVELFAQALYLNTGFAGPGLRLQLGNHVALKIHL